MSEYEQRVREDRQYLHNTARKMLDKAKAENRDLFPDEEARFDQIMKDLDDINDRLDKFAEDARISRLTDESLRNLQAGGRTSYLSQGDHALNTKFREVIRSRSFEPIDIGISKAELRSGFQPGLERRDLYTTSGGGLVPTNFWRRIERHMVDSSAVLAAGATVIETDSGEPLRVPKSTAFSTASIVTEGSLIGESDPGLGSVALGAYKYGFRVEVSYELAEDVNFDLLGFLAEQAGIAVGNASGAHFVNGTGTGQPRGILADATTGVTGPTGTATSFGSQTTAGQGGDLLNDLVASLAEPYARSASAGWLMRSATLNAIRKLRDSQGRYIFDSDIPLGSGAAGTLLGRPVYLDPSMPAMGAGNKSVVFGDLSRYWVRRVNGIRFERSNDFAFDRDMISFRVLARLDGALIDTSGALKTFVHSAT